MRRNLDDCFSRGQALRFLASGLGCLLVSPAHGQNKRASAISLLVTPRGIFPAEVSVVPGPVNISILSRTGHGTTEFRLNPVGESRVVAIARIDAAATKLQRSNTLINLSPGEYELNIPGRAGVVCRISVKP